MSEELKFQKLGEVELLEEAPEGSHPLVEHDGKIKRVTGGIGGGIPVFDLTPYIISADNVDITGMEDGFLRVFPTFTDQDVENFFKLASGAILIHLDVFAVFKTVGMPTTSEDSTYILNQVFSTQYLSAEGMRGVWLYNSLADLMLFSEDSFMSAVGYMGGIPVAQFVFPLGAQFFAGG